MSKYKACRSKQQTENKVSKVNTEFKNYTMFTSVHSQNKVTVFNCSENKLNIKNVVTKSPKIMVNLIFSARIDQIICLKVLRRWK